LGSFGIGSKITTYLSHWLDVWTYRNGEYESIEFREGEFSERGSGKVDLPNGTCVEWQPSEEFFTHPEVNITELKTLFKTIAALCPALNI